VDSGLAAWFSTLKTKTVSTWIAIRYGAGQLLYWYNCQLHETGYYASYWVQPVKPAVSTYDVEVTDTFGGEANYAWCRRYTLTVPADIKPATFMRKVKDLIGWTGVRCNVSDFGNGSLDIRPRGVCQVCFTSYHDGD
jgi:hypothetical protein